MIVDKLERRGGYERSVLVLKTNCIYIYHCKNTWVILTTFLGCLSVTKESYIHVARLPNCLLLISVIH